MLELRRIRVLGAPAVLAVLVCAHVASAQSERSLAKDDLLYARELARNGFADLAGDFLDVFEKLNKTNRDEMIAVDGLRLDLREDAAYREPDKRKRLALLEKVVLEKEGYAADNARLELAIDLVARLPDLYRQIGELVAAILTEEPSAADADELKARSSKLFEKSLADLQEQVGVLALKRDGQALDAVDPELERQYMLATYNLARTRYYHALVLDSGSAEQKASVEQALALLFDFQLDFSDQLLCYEGFIYEGLCHQLLGDDAKANESFDSTIRLRESYEKSSNGVFEMPPVASDLVSNAVYQKVLGLAAIGDKQNVIAVAEEFLSSTPDPLTTYRGASIQVAAAEAYRALGNQQAVEAAAKRLIDADPRGPAGEQGRLLLREGGASRIGAGDSLELAKSAAARGEIERAIELAQDAARLAFGTTNEHDAGSKAGVLIGALYAQQGSLHEAAVAWDTAADRYAKGVDAAECLWRAINAYLTLGGQEKSKFYRERARARMTELSSRYSASPYASQAAFIEGQELEQERKYAEAAALYETIAAQPAVREEALFRAGQAWSRAAREAFSGKKKQDGPALAAKSEARLTEALPALEALAEKTRDRTTQERLLSLAFAARVGLANLFLLEGVGRAADALPLFADSESRFARDAQKLSTARRVRMKALQQSGRLEDAVAILDQCHRADATLPGMAAAAASLAQAIDASASKVEHDDPLSTEIEKLRRRAAEYYDLALESVSPGPDGLETAEVELIADRLYALALQFNGVATESETFVDSTSRRPDPDAFERALRAYGELAKRQPSSRTDILIGRTLAFLGRWPEATARYAELFAREPFVDLEKRTIANERMRVHPEFLPALLEWAVCERQTGAPKSDTERLGRASAILETIVLVAKDASRTWWHAKFYQLRVLLDRGEYELAAAALRSIDRNYPEYDESQYGVREKFQALADELERLGHIAPAQPPRDK